MHAPPCVYSMQDAASLEEDGCVVGHVPGKNKL